MFSSNQKFSVSCRKDQLSEVIELALSMYDGRREKGTSHIRRRMTGDLLSAGIMKSLKKDGKSSCLSARRLG